MSRPEPAGKTTCAVRYLFTCRVSKPETVHTNFFSSRLYINTSWDAVRWYLMSCFPRRPPPTRPSSSALQRGVRLQERFDILGLQTGELAYAAAPA